MVAENGKSPEITVPRTATVTPMRGRPSDYRPEYCQLAIELGAQGYSKAEIAAELGPNHGVSFDTLERWQQAHADFRESILRARQLSLAWWERHARDNTRNRDFNANLYRIAMHGRFPEYRERALVEVTQQTTNVDLTLLTGEQREQLALLLTQASRTLPAADLEPGAASKTAENGHSED